MPPASPTSLKISLRVDIDGKGRLGPGKAALMAAISETGTISSAAKQLGMSYPRALKLVDELNGLSCTPLVLKQHGGAQRGGAQLSPTGQSVLAHYQMLCQKVSEMTNAVQSDLLDLISRPET